MKKQVSGFGLIIIGSEILDGRVRDRHLENTRRQLAERRLLLHYVLILPDDPSVLGNQFRWAGGQPSPFFCCGGIGATPDDHTRLCAAEAFGVELASHKEAAAILKKKFGARATPHRLKMVEFPAGSRIIPNPYNQVPGFSIANGYFLPGFPEMAEPMTAWVLDTYYHQGAERISRSLVLPDGRESDLVGLMEDFIAAYPDLALSSLPRIAGKGWDLVLGVAGAPAAVEEGMRYLREELRKAGQRYSDEGRKK